MCGAKAIFALVRIIFMGLADKLICYTINLSPKCGYCASDIIILLNLNFKN